MTDAEPILAKVRKLLARRREGGAADRHTAAMRRRTTGALLAALLLGGCTGGTEQDGGSVPSATPTAAATSSHRAARPPRGAELREIRLVAARAVETILSYGHRTLGTDEAAATALMTPAYAREFRRSFARLRDEALAVQGSSRAVVVASGVVAASADEVQVLAFVDRTTRSSVERRGVTQAAPVVTVARAGREWRVADIATGEAPPGPAPDPGARVVIGHAVTTAEAYLDLHWETVEADLAVMESLVVDPLAAEYARGGDELVEAVRAHRTVQEGTVLAVGLEERGAGHASVLVSAAVTVRHEATGGDPASELRRLRLHLVDSGGAWRTSRLTVVD